MLSLCPIHNVLSVSLQLFLKVGCGAIKFRDERNFNTVIVVCQYAPQGNIISRNVFEIGPPCTGCANGCNTSVFGGVLCN